MARRDGTGPMGQGPITGRGLGNCIDANAVAGGGRSLGIGHGAGLEMGCGAGRRMGCGMGIGRSFGRLVDPKTSENNVGSLKAQKEILEKRLEDINNQLDM